jgi:uncharacterized protein
MQTPFLIIGAISIAVIGLAASWIAGSVMMRGRPSNVASAEAPARDITIRTHDHIAIAGTFRPGRSDYSSSVLILHGAGASRGSTATSAAWLAGLGYAVLTIDFRGHGGSDIGTRTFGLREAIDARAAFDWLKQQQSGAPIVVIGISLGGAASLIGEDGPLPADGLVLQAVYPNLRIAIRNRIAERLSKPIAYLLEPFLSFQALPRFGVWPSRLAPLNALKRYKGSIFLIGGMEDRSTSALETRAMFDEVKGTRKLWLVPNGDHAAISNLSGSTYRNLVLEFLKDTMACPS